MKQRLIEGLYVKLLSVFGTFNKGRECPLCGWQGYQFLPTKPGIFFRFEAICPGCGSAERHRLVLTLLQERLPFAQKRILHFAPEPVLANWLRSAVLDYVSADLAMRDVDDRIDICDMPYDNASFDIVWASHVLEHVESDAKAISEIHRVLKPGGVAVIQVPIWGRVTDEGRSFSSEDDRVREYFQHDHVRRYGHDIVERLSRPGFEVDELTVEDAPLHLVLRYGLASLSANSVHVCRRPDLGA